MGPPSLPAEVSGQLDVAPCADPGLDSALHFHLQSGALVTVCITGLRGAWTGW